MANDANWPILCLEMLDEAQPVNKELTGPEMSIVELLPEPIQSRLSAIASTNNPNHGNFAELLAEHSSSNNIDDRAAREMHPEDVQDISKSDKYDNEDSQVEDRERFEEEEPRDDQQTASEKSTSDESALEQSATTQSNSDDDRSSNGDTNNRPQTTAHDDHASGIAIDENSSPSELTPSDALHSSNAKTIGDTQVSTNIGDVVRKASTMGAGDIASSKAAIFSDRFIEQQSITPLQNARQNAAQSMQSNVDLNIVPTSNNLAAPASSLDANLMASAKPIQAATPTLATPIVQKSDQSALSTFENPTNQVVSKEKLPPLVNLTAIAQFMPQERAGEINSLIQFFQAKMGQGAANTTSDTANGAATSGTANSGMADAMKNVSGQFLPDGQTNPHNNQGQSALGLAVSGTAKGGAEGQPTTAGNGIGNFASSLALNAAGQSSQINNMQFAQSVHAANNPAPHHAATNMQSPTIQIAFQMAKAIDQGVNRMSIRLDPAELGRIQIQLEVGGDGRVQATILADKQDTLDLLQKDSKMLEKAMKDAGLDTSSEDLSFSLQQGSQNHWAAHDTHDRSASSQNNEDEAYLEIEVETDASEPIISNRALDVRV